MNCRSSGQSISLDTLLHDSGSDTQSVSREMLLADILAEFSELYKAFNGNNNNFKMFKEAYEACWFHSGQIVQIESQGDSKFRITGVDPTSGLLRAEHSDTSKRSSSPAIELEPNGNSFDMMSNMIIKKVSHQS